MLPHEPVYQFHVAPVPKLPPLIPKVVLFPGQIGVVPVAEVAAVEIVFNVTVLFAQSVELHVPTALT